MLDRIKLGLKHLLLPLLYRFPPSALKEHRLYLFLDELRRCRDVPGCVVEIGCNAGGTAIIAHRFIEGLGIGKEYWAYDTFEGFVTGQWEREASGLSQSLRTLFSANSLGLVRRILRLHGAGAIRLVKADIVACPDSALPPALSVAWIDVDLARPTAAALSRLWPRLSPGGVLLVDDCAPEDGWKAREGCDEFVAASGAAAEYAFGVGIFRKPAV